MALNLLDAETRITIKDSELPDIPDGDPEVTYTVRQIPPAVNRELSRKHTSRPINRKTGQRETEVDQIALVDDLLDYALVGWTGILVKGQPAPCDQAHKLCLDYQRKAALLMVAGLNQRAEEDRAASFRSLA